MKGKFMPKKEKPINKKIPKKKQTSDQRNANRHKISWVTH